MNILSRYSLALASVLLLAGVLPVQTPQRFTLAPASTVHIEGTSSVHDWACIAADVVGWVEVEASADGPPAVARVEVKVPVQSIDCKNGTMDKKTRKALDAEAHPAIRYVLKAAKAQPGTDARHFSLQTTGKLTVAGVERDLAMTVEAERLADGRYRFTGRTALYMTNFGVDPPTALLGTLKTGDRIVVHFDVIAAPRDA